MLTTKARLDQIRTLIEELAKKLPHGGYGGSAANLKTLIDNIAVPEIVDALTSIDVNKALSANQGKILKGFIDDINTLLASDDTTLDQLQEVVDFIKANKDDLNNLSIANISGLQSALANTAKLNLPNNFTGRQTLTGNLVVGGTSETARRALVFEKGLDSNPHFWKIRSMSNAKSTGWMSEIHFQIRKKFSNTYYNILRLHANNGDKGKVDINADLEVFGAAKFGGLTIPTLKLGAGAATEIIQWTSNIMDGSIKVSGYNPRYTDFEVLSNGPGNGWHAGMRFYCTNGERTKKLGLTIFNDSSGGGSDMKVTAHGKFKPERLDLSALGTYADDIAAASGGVAIGFAYINSATGAVHRRLT